MDWKIAQASSFKKTDEGYVFYPWGVLVAGYLVTDEKKKEIEKFLSQFFIVAIILLAPAIAALANNLTLVTIAVCTGIFVALSAYYQWRISRLTNGLARSRVRLMVSDVEQAFADSDSFAKLYLLFAIGVVFTLMGALVLVRSLYNDDTNGLWLGIGGIVFFGGGLFWFLRLIKLKQGHRW